MTLESTIKLERRILGTDIEPWNRTSAMETRCLEGHENNTAFTLLTRRMTEAWSSTIYEEANPLELGAPYRSPDEADGYTFDREGRGQGVAQSKHYTFSSLFPPRPKHMGRQIHKKYPTVNTSKNPSPVHKHIHRKFTRYELLRRPRTHTHRKTMNHRQLIEHKAWTCPTKPQVA